MYLCSLLHGHGTSFCPAASGSADRMHAGHELAVAAEHVEHRAAHARHQLHVDDDVRAVGELDADVRDRAAERAHRERHHVDRAAAHAAVEQAVRASRASPPARPSCWSGPRPLRFSLQMNVRSSTRATSDGIGPGEIAVRALGRIRAACSVPLATISAHSRSYSSALPSHQTMRSGLVERGDLAHPGEQAADGERSRRRTAAARTDSESRSFMVSGGMLRFRRRDARRRGALGAELRQPRRCTMRATSAVSRASHPQIGPVV